MIDGYKHKGLRRKLLEALRIKGIHDESVLAAMNAVPRHFFLEKAFEELAYQDKAMAIGMEQTISQPYTVAFQSQLLQVKPGEKILEIGTGSGYQACVLAQLGAQVYTLERIPELSVSAKKMFEKLHLSNIKSYVRNGYEGLPEAAPFDKILVTCGAETIPQTLTAQLAMGGKMVIPVGGGQSQTMVRLTKTASNSFDKEYFGEFRFVPFVEK